MQLLRQWLHVQDVDDVAFSLDERDRKRDVCVLHPERRLPFLLEDEQHPLIVRQALTEHQTARPLLRRIRHLDQQVDLVAVLVHEGDAGKRRAVTAGGCGCGNGAPAVVAARGGRA